MSPASNAGLGTRHAQVRGALRAANLDALVVTHSPNVFYLVGFRGSAGILVLAQNHADLIVDFRYVEAAQVLIDSGCGPPNTTVVPVEGSYDATLLATLVRRRLFRVGAEGQHLPVSRFNWLALAAGEGRGTGERAIELVPTDRMVERWRIRKDPVEVETLRTAADRLSELAARVVDLVAVGRTEQAVAADIDWRIRQAGFQGPAFETIVASGASAARPHWRAGSRRLERGDLVVLDFGGVYEGYCVDLTRTVSIGTPTDEATRVYRAVALAQEVAIGAVRPGVLASDVDGAARRALEREGLGDLFGHGTGHGLGIEVHEEPRIGRRPAAVAGFPPPEDPVLEPGMVFTVEPGVYRRGWGGVRIEDDVLVTADGCEVLTRGSRELLVR